MLNHFITKFGTFSVNLIATRRLIIIINQYFVINNHYSVVGNQIQYIIHAISLSRLFSFFSNSVIHFHCM